MNVQEPKIISLPSSSLSSLLAFSLLCVFLMEERIVNSLAKSDLGLRAGISPHKPLERTKESGQLFVARGVSAPPRDLAQA